MLTFFHLMKCHVTFLRPVTFVASFLHRMVLICKVFINHTRKSFLIMFFYNNLYMIDSGVYLCMTGEFLEPYELICKVLQIVPVIFVASFLHCMVLICKVFINRIRKAFPLWFSIVICTWQTWEDYICMNDELIASLGYYLFITDEFLVSYGVNL